MSISARLISILVLAACLFGGSILTAREFNMAQGQLLRVDANARKIVIQTEQGAQLQCTFTGETRVTGTSSTIATLRAKDRLTVHYAKDQTEFVATEIEVHGTRF